MPRGDSLAEEIRRLREKPRPTAPRPTLPPRPTAATRVGLRSFLPPRPDQGFVPSPSKVTRLRGGPIAGLAEEVQGIRALYPAPISRPPVPPPALEPVFVPGESQPFIETPTTRAVGGLRPIELPRRPFEVPSPAALGRGERKSLGLPAGPEPPPPPRGRPVFETRAEEEVYLREETLKTDVGRFYGRAFLETPLGTEINSYFLSPIVQHGVPGAFQALLNTVPFLWGRGVLQASKMVERFAGGRRRDERTLYKVTGPGNRESLAADVREIIDSPRTERIVGEDGREVEITIPGFSEQLSNYRTYFDSLPEGLRQELGPEVDRIAYSSPRHQEAALREMASARELAGRPLTRDEINIILERNEDPGAEAVGDILFTALVDLPGIGITAQAARGIAALGRATLITPRLARITSRLTAAGMARRAKEAEAFVSSARSVREAGHRLFWLDDYVVPVEDATRLAGQFQDEFVRAGLRWPAAIAENTDDVGKAIQRGLAGADSGITPGLPEWVREEMIRTGRPPGRLFNEVDLANPSIREAILSDPILNQAQKQYVLRTGAIPPELRISPPKLPIKFSERVSAGESGILRGLTAPIRWLVARTPDAIADSMADDVTEVLRNILQSAPMASQDDLLNVIRVLKDDPSALASRFPVAGTKAGARASAVLQAIPEQNLAVLASRDQAKAALVIDNVVNALVPSLKGANREVWRVRGFLGRMVMNNPIFPLRNYISNRELVAWHTGFMTLDSLDEAKAYMRAFYVGGIPSRSTTRGIAGPASSFMDQGTAVHFENIQGAWEPLGIFRDRPLAGIGRGMPTQDLWMRVAQTGEQNIGFRTHRAATGRQMNILWHRGNLVPDPPAGIMASLSPSELDDYFRIVEEGLDPQQTRLLLNQRFSGQNVGRYPDLSEIRAVGPDGEALARGIDDILEAGGSKAQVIKKLENLRTRTLGHLDDLAKADDSLPESALLPDPPKITPRQLLDRERLAEVTARNGLRKEAMLLELRRQGVAGEQVDQLAKAIDDLGKQAEREAKALWNGYTSVPPEQRSLIYGDINSRAEGIWQNFQRQADEAAFALAPDKQVFGSRVGRYPWSPAPRNMVSLRGQAIAREINASQNRIDDAFLAVKKIRRGPKARAALRESWGRRAKEFERLTGDKMPRTMQDMRAWALDNPGKATLWMRRLQDEAKLLRVKPSIFLDRMLSQSVARSSLPSVSEAAGVTRDFTWTETDDIIEWVRGNWGRVGVKRPEALVGELLAHYDSEVTPALSRAKGFAEAAGTYNRDLALLRYSDRRRFDEIAYKLGMGWPYWSTRTGFNALTQMLEHPIYLSWLYRILQVQDAFTRDLPPQYRMQFHIPGIGFVNPLGLAFPLIGYLYGVDTFSEELQEGAPLTESVAKAIGLGPLYGEDSFGALSMLPIYGDVVEETLGEWIKKQSLSPEERRRLEESIAAGETEDVMRSVGWTWLGRVSYALTGMSIEAPLVQATAAMANTIRPMLGLPPLKVELEPPYQKSWIRREIWEMVGDGDIDRAEYDEALRTQAGPVWEEAVRRAREKYGILEATGSFTGVRFRPDTLLETEREIARAGQEYRLIFAMPPGKERDEAIEAFHERWPEYRAFQTVYRPEEFRENLQNRAEFFQKVDAQNESQTQERSDFILANPGDRRGLGEIIGRQIDEDEDLTLEYRGRGVTFPFDPEFKSSDAVGEWITKRVLFLLSQSEPDADQFKDELGRIDWDAWEAAVKKFWANPSQMWNTEAGKDLLGQIGDGFAQLGPDGLSLGQEWIDFAREIKLSENTLREWRQENDVPAEAASFIHKEYVNAAREAYQKIWLLPTAQRDVAQARLFAQYPALSGEELIARVMTEYPGRWTRAELIQAIGKVEFPSAFYQFHRYDTERVIGQDMFWDLYYSLDKDHQGDIRDAADPYGVKLFGPRIDLSQSAVQILLELTGLPSPWDNRDAALEAWEQIILGRREIKALATATTEAEETAEEANEKLARTRVPSGRRAAPAPLAYPVGEVAPELGPWLEFMAISPPAPLITALAQNFFANEPLGPADIVMLQQIYSLLEPGMAFDEWLAGLKKSWLSGGRFLKFTIPRRRGPGGGQFMEGPPQTRYSH